MRPWHVRNAPRRRRARPPTRPPASPPGPAKPQHLREDGVDVMGDAQHVAGVRLGGLTQPGYLRGPAIAGIAVAVGHLVAGAVGGTGVEGLVQVGRRRLLVLRTRHPDAAAGVHLQPAVVVRRRDRVAGLHLPRQREELMCLCAQPAHRLLRYAVPAQEKHAGLAQPLVQGLGHGVPLVGGPGPPRVEVDDWYDALHGGFLTWCELCDVRRGVTRRPPWRGCPFRRPVRRR